MNQSMESQRRAVLVCSVYKSQHGGSLYFQNFSRVLKAEGWGLGLMSQDVLENDESFDWQLVLPGFFRPGIRALVARIWDWNRVLATLARVRPGLIVVQGDLPRLGYLILQCCLPLMFIRQDSILTCPANDRFLPAAKRVCCKPAGFSCLKVDRREGCMQNLSLIKKLGRICYRLRDKWLLRSLENFIGNSRHILNIHGRSDGGLIKPPTPGCSSESSSTHHLQTLVFCGRLEFVKGAEEALRILACLPSDYRLVMIGEGSLRPQLESLAANLAIDKRVEFCGWLNSTGRDARLGLSGVLLMPSLCDEAFGMTGLEAFAAGTPVVAYNVGGVSEWCVPEGGRLVNCGDHQAAAAAVLEMTEDVEVWQTLSQGALSFVKKEYPPWTFQKEVIQAVESCLNRAKGTGI